MRGIDGNYMSAQGDQTARVQTAYQSAQVAQQVHAQKEVADSFRKLREVVSETGRKEAGAGTPAVGRDGNSKSGGYQAGEGNPQMADLSEKGNTPEEGPLFSKQTHIDIRV